MDYICPSCSAQLTQFSLEVSHKTFEGGLGQLVIHAQCPLCDDEIARVDATVHFVSGMLTVVKWENDR